MDRLAQLLIHSLIYQYIVIELYKLSSGNAEVEMTSIVVGNDNMQASQMQVYFGRRIM